MKNILALGFFAIVGVFLATNVLAGWRKSTPDIASIKVLEANEDIFDSLNSSEASIVVDFYADWCGPCNLQSDVFGEVAKSLPDDAVRIIKVDVDKHSQLANQFQVRSIPSLFVFKNGKVIDHHVGVADKTQVANWLELP